MIKINLIPPEYIARVNRKAAVAKAVLAGVVVAASVLMVTLWHITRSKTIESTLAKREVELKALQKDVDQVKAIEAQISEVQRYLDAIASINKGRFTYTHFLQELTSDLPSTMWFNGLNTAVDGEGLKVDITLNSNSAYDLAYWINSLETAGPYSEVMVGGITVTDAPGGKRFSTPLGLKYSYK